MTQTPLERAAEQLLKANDPEGYAYWIASGRKKMAQQHHEQASAVLMAIRDPSEGMKAVGLVAANDCMEYDYDSDADGQSFGYHYLRPDVSASTWQAMIDAALEEQ